MEFQQLVSNENQRARFKTFSTLKMIYTGCSMTVMEKKMK